MNNGLSLVLLLAVFQPLLARVHWDDIGFSKCSEFFFQDTPPSGFVKLEHVRKNGGFAAPICQTYKLKTYYATLYNIQFRTPMYSAYKMNQLPVGKVSSGFNSPFGAVSENPLILARLLSL
jgi:hypothetical protein